MAILSLGKFKGTYKDMGQKSAVAENITAAAALLSTDTEDNRLVILQEVEAGVVVEVPDNDTDFTITISPVEAANAGAVAMPSGYHVKPGTAVIVQATVPEGWEFLGWYEGATELSTALLTTITVPYNPNPSTPLQYEARYQLIP